MKGGVARERELGMPGAVIVSSVLGGGDAGGVVGTGGAFETMLREGVFEANLRPDAQQLVGPPRHPEGALIIGGGITGPGAVRIVPEFVAQGQERVGRDAVHGVIDKASRPYKAVLGRVKRVLERHGSRRLRGGVFHIHVLGLEGGPVFVVELVAIAPDTFLKVIEAERAVVERVHPGVP